MPVTTVLTILISLIVAAPVLMIIGSAFWEGFIPAIAAIAIALVALSLSEDKAHRLATLLKPLAAILLIPCAWILFQLVPVGGHWLAHPAWTSAAAALGKPFPGAVTLDIGATLLGLARYVLLLAIAIVAAAVALDRQHAKIILHLLVAVAAVIAAGLIGFSHLGATGFDLAVQRPQMADIAMIGVILSGAAAIQAYEPHDTQRTRGRSSSGSIYAVAIPLVTAGICLSAIIIDPDTALLPAAACGIGVLISVEAIRRLRLGPWGRSGIVAAAIVALIGFFAINPIAKDTDPTLALARSSQGSVPIAERILADGRWVGTGAGTFQVLVPIYRDADDAETRTAPTAAAKVAIEMGRPFFWTLAILTLIGASMLFMRALTRGRDHLYAGAGAGCLVAILVSSFGNVGAFGLITSVFVSVICGLALAQSKGWSALDLAMPGLKIPSDPQRPMDWRLRAGLLAFAVLLAAQAVWIIPAEYYRPRRIPFPVDPQASRVVSHEREHARRAASLAIVRGDLWADSALTHADLLWKEPATGPDASRNAGQESRADIEHALRYSPHRGDVWLMLAIMADRYNWSEYQPGALLKMSYFTAPSELALFPLRIKASLRPDVLKDPEIRDMAKHDLRVIITRAPALKPALAATYRTSSAEAKAFLDRAIMEIDPLYLAVMRADL